MGRRAWCVFSVLDLFSGIGGFAIATEMAGGEVVAFCETAQYPSSVLRARWPDVPNYGDVRKFCRRVHDCDVDPAEPDVVWCPRCGDDFGQCGCIGTDQFVDAHGFPDVITAGVPCQPTSLAGKRRGTADERWLWPETLRIIGELRPRFALMENPRALLSLDGGRAFADILGALAELRYDVLWDVVSASALGAGHRRERLWILATDADSARLERHARHGEGGWKPQANGHAAPRDFREREITGAQWYHQSGIQPVVDGIPGRLARDRLTAVGNAVVPQVALVWMMAIAEHLEKACGIPDDKARCGPLAAGIARRTSRLESP